MLLFAATLAAPLAAQAPRLTIDQPTADLGTVGVGEPASHEFVVRNTGAAVLKLDVPKPKLAKGVSAVPPGDIAPGASARVRVTIDTLQVVGPEVKVTLISNDLTQPQMTLLVRIAVRPFILAEPGYARYNYVQHEREGTIPQLLWSADGTDFRVLRVTSPYPHIRVSHREATAAEREKDQPGRQWVVALTIASDSPVGPIGDYVQVETDHPKQKKVWIPVSGFVRPMFAVTPPAVSLGTIAAGGQPRTIRLHVKNFAEAQIGLKGAATNVPGITAAITVAEPGRVFYVDLSVAPKVPGPIAGSLTITTASAKQPRVEVSISGTVVPVKR